MTRADLWVDRWISVLNTQDRERAETCLSETVTVLAYEEGVGGPSKTYEGLDAVHTWINKPAPGRFRFERLSAAEGRDHAELPTASETYTARYRITHPESGFTNTGRWEIAIDDDRIVGLLHLPEPLDD